MVKKWRNVCLMGAGSIGCRHIRLLCERGDITAFVAELSNVGRSRIFDEDPTVKRYRFMEVAVSKDTLLWGMIATLHAMLTEPAKKVRLLRLFLPRTQKEPQMLSMCGSH